MVVTDAMTFHMSFGITILALMFLRLLWRITHPVAPASSLPAWQQTISEAVHWLLYALVLVMSKLASPWHLIRLATRAAGSDDAKRIAATSSHQPHKDIEYRVHLIAGRDREHAVVNVLRANDAPAAAFSVSIAVLSLVTPG